MKVRATKEYKTRNITDKDLRRIPEENEIFEVTEERFNILHGNNDYNVIFVERVEEENKVTAVPKVKKETAKKKTTTTKKATKKDK